MNVESQRLVKDSKGNRLDEITFCKDLPPEL
jgi:hypothetical protein